MAEERRFFREMAKEVPQYAKHLEDYRLVSPDSQELRIPMLARFLRQGEPAGIPVQGAVAGDGLMEISRLRNALEPKLRKFVKRVLKTHLGEEGWIRPLLDVIPSERRLQYAGVDRDEILTQRVFLLDLLQVIDANWGKYFRFLEAGPPVKRVQKEHVKVLLEFVNTHRQDAHAKAVGQTEVATLGIVIGALNSIIDSYLSD